MTNEQRTNDKGRMTSKFGSTLLRYGRVSSTNDLAQELAASGADEGTCILAREQTAGRGRQGRSWSSPAGEGLYLSLILRPQIKAAQSSIITLAAGVAVAETLKFDFDLPTDIKWPNDVLAMGRKICGILVESAIEGEHIEYAVMGIGVNLGQASFPDVIGDSATSLFIETGRSVSPDDFVEPLLCRLESWYRTAIAYRNRVVARWEELSSYAHGYQVRVESAEGSIEGLTDGLASSGALIVKLGNGEKREIVSGDVSIRALGAPR